MVPDMPGIPQLPAQNGLSPNVAGNRFPNQAITASGTLNSRAASVTVPPARIRDVPHPDLKDHPRISGLQVIAPAGARVTLNGKALAGSGKTRTFTPDEQLMPGIPYKYTVTAEVVHGGQSFSRSETVWLRAGRMMELTFQLPETDEEDDLSEKVAKTR